MVGLSGKALTQYRRRQIGIVSQSFNLIPSLTARENVEMPLRSAGTRGRNGRRRASVLLARATRLSPFWRMLGLAMIVGGVVAFRFDTNIVGFLTVISYLPGEAMISYTSYSPSQVEWAAGLGIIAFGLLAFSIGVKYLRVVDHRPTSEEYETVHVMADDAIKA